MSGGRDSLRGLEQDAVGDGGRSDVPLDPGPQPVDVGDDGVGWFGCRGRPVPGPSVCVSCLGQDLGEGPLSAAALQACRGAVHGTPDQRMPKLHGVIAYGEEPGPLNRVEHFLPSRKPCGRGFHGRHSSGVVCGGHQQQGLRRLGEPAIAVEERALDPFGDRELAW